MAEPEIVWDEKHTVRKIGLKPEQIHVLRPPQDYDTIIKINIGGESFEAMVPTSAMYPVPSHGAGHKFVPAEQVGRLGDKLIIVLPPSNDGTPIWHVREEDLAAVLVP